MSLRPQRRVLHPVIVAGRTNVNAHKRAEAMSAIVWMAGEAGGEANAVSANVLELRGAL